MPMFLWCLGRQWLFSIDVVADNRAPPRAGFFIACKNLHCTAPIQGLDIDRGLSVFGFATPIAPSWECCWGRI